MAENSKIEWTENVSDSADQMRTRPTLRRTPVREFLLSELSLWGRRSFPGRYTLSLRIMEENGYVGRNADPDPRYTRWYAKQRGLDALGRWRP